MWIVLPFFFLCLVGCNQAKTLPGNIVAKVNTYSITVEELEHELAAAWPVLQNYPNLPPSEMKTKVLDVMIVNQLLLEEAQKLNADKEPAFMREVENYWRQALLKTLLAQKNAEFSAKVPVSEASLKALYVRETEDLKLDLVILSDEGAAKALSSASGDAFEATVAKLGAKVLKHDKPGFWSSGDLPEEIEARLWSLADGKVSPPLWSPDEGWIVARVLTRNKVNLLPFEDMRDSLRKRIVRKTLSNMTDDWISELRTRAKIVTNSQAVEKIAPGAASRAGGSDGK